MNIICFAGQIVIMGRWIKQPPIILSLFSIPYIPCTDACYSCSFHYVFPLAICLALAFPFPNYTHSSNIFVSFESYIFSYFPVFRFPFYENYVTGLYGTCAMCRGLSPPPPISLSLSLVALLPGHKYSSRTFYLARLSYCWLVLVAII